MMKYNCTDWIMIYKLSARDEVLSIRWKVESDRIATESSSTTDVAPRTKRNTYNTYIIQCKHFVFSFHYQCLNIILIEHQIKLFNQDVSCYALVYHNVQGAFLALLLFVAWDQSHHLLYYFSDEHESGCNEVTKNNAIEA